MARTWSGAWCGQRGNGYGRRMKSPPWTPCRHPPGQKAPWVHIVPTSARWPSGWATRPHPSSNEPRAATFSSCGDWGTRGAPSRSQCRHSQRWRTWDGCPRSSVAGSGAVPNGRPRNRPYGPTQVWTTSATSRWLARSDRSGPSMGWRSWHSPAFCGWVKTRPSVGGGSRCRGLAFRTVKVAPRIVRRRLGKYAQEWLDWLDAKGATSAVVGAQFCPQGPAFMQSVMAAALGGSDNPHATWHAWRRGGSAALRWLGLPIKWLAWWGRWLSETVAVHYADAPNDFVVTTEAVLPWPSDDRT